MDSLHNSGSWEHYFEAVIGNSHQLAADPRYNVANNPSFFTSYLQLALIDSGSLRLALYMELGMHAQMEAWKKPREDMPLA